MSQFKHHANNDRQTASADWGRKKKQIRKNACWVSKHAMNWTVKQEGEWDWEKVSTKTSQHGSFGLIENMDTDEKLVDEKTNNIN